MNRPSPLICGSHDCRLPLAVPNALTLTTFVTSLTVSRTKMSSKFILAFSGARFVALVTNTTNRPSPLIAASRTTAALAVAIPGITLAVRADCYQLCLLLQHVAHVEIE